MDVTEEGFEFDGKLYRSLTSVAREITGAAWSGPWFFGLAKAADACGGTDIWLGGDGGSLGCNQGSGVRCSLTISPTIKIGVDRNAPIGPHIQIQNNRDRTTARLLISSRRPMIVGVMN